MLEQRCGYACCLGRLFGFEFLGFCLYPSWRATTSADRLSSVKMSRACSCTSRKDSYLREDAPPYPSVIASDLASTNKVRHGSTTAGVVVRAPSSRRSGSTPTLVSPAAKSPSVAVTGMSAKEASQFYASVITTQSMHGRSTTPCQIGLSLSDTKQEFTMPEHITPPQLGA
jgi:hypothetical protein